MILKPPKGTLINRSHNYSRGLVGCWLMNEGGGNIVNDLSGNGNTGTFSGSDIVWSGGLYGPAPNCLGTSGDIELASTVSLGAVNTVVFCFAPADAGDYVCFGDNTSNSYWRLSGANTLNIKNAAGTARSITTLPTAWSAGWNLVAVASRTANSVDVWQNGVYAGEITVLGPAINVNRIGHGYSGTTLQYKGKLGFCMLYNGVSLQDSQIINLSRDPFQMLEVDL